MYGYLIEARFRNPGQKEYTSAIFTRTLLSEAEEIAASLTNGVDREATIHPIGEPIQAWRNGIRVDVTEETPQ